jgi:hypothetical protein
MKNSRSSKNHSIKKVEGYSDWFIISWDVGFKSSSRTFDYRTTKRDTDRKGAIRFAKQWNLEIPI